MEIRLLADNTLPILLENLAQVSMNIEAVKLRLLTRANCTKEQLDREIEETIMPNKLKLFIRATLHEYQLEQEASEMQLRQKIEDENKTLAQSLNEGNLKSITGNLPG